jgi:general secretion pathway protein H
VKKQRGYTLIEILVVLFIISIVTSVALLSIGRNQNKQVEAVANELAQMLSLAEEQAMLQPAVLGLAVNEHRFGFYSLQPVTEKKKDQWLALKDNVLGAHTVPDNIALSITAQGQQEVAPNTPQIIISTNGDITPFSIYIGKKGEKPLYVVSAAADGSISKQAVGT